MKRFLIFAIVVFVIATTVCAGTINSSVIFYMPANGTASETTFYDLSNNAYTITTSGDTKIKNSNSSWRFNNATYFDGTGDRLTASPMAANMSGDFTVAFWFNSTSSTTWNGLVGNMNTSTGITGTWRIGTRTNAGNVLNLVNEGTLTGSSSKNYNDGVWHYLVLIKNGTALNMTVDGVYKINASAGSWKWGALSRDLTLGYQSVDNIYYTGYLDDVVILNYAVADPKLVPQIEFVDTPPTTNLILANFTQSPNPSAQDASVTFNDTSTGTPTTWNWTFGDGNTSTTQNPTYAFPDFGSFWVDLNVTNSTGSFSNYTALHTVTNATGYTPQDVWMEGQYNRTFHITSSSDGTPLAANYITSDGQSGTASATGYAFITEGFGVYTITVSMDNYATRTVSFVVDEDGTTEIQLTPTTPGGTYNTYPPKDVKFHITSFFGAPISGASVSILGVTTSTGNWDWLVTLLGIPLDEVAINGTAMTETTDSSGDVVFLMVPSVKYNITVSATGYTFPSTIIAPQATEYTIAANWNESWFTSGNDTLGEVNVSVSWVKLNDTYSFMNITYDDQTATTTGGTIYVYRDLPGRASNASAVTTMAITGSSCSNSTLLNTPTGGASYRVQVNATTIDQNIVRTFTHYFKGAPVTIPGFDSQNLLWLSLFIVIFTAAFAGATHSPQMSIILCVEMWVFWAIGWLNALIEEFYYGEVSLLGIMTLATFLAILWNVTEGKAKGKRSS